MLYGWRMHPGSTALNEDSKNYLAESQKSVVRHALERLDLADRFEVVPACDGVLGYYHAVRRTAGRASRPAACRDSRRMRHSTR